MAWDETATQILRVLLDDLGDTPRYTDAKLLSVLVVAALQINQELDFTTTYTVNVTNETVTPDPEDDEAFINLVTLKSACIVNRAELLIAANRAIYVKDGAASVDLRGVPENKLKVLERGWCAAYQDAKCEFIRVQAGVSRSGATTAGAAVLSPFRFFARSYFRTL